MLFLNWYSFLFITITLSSIEDKSSQFLILIKKNIMEKFNLIPVMQIPERIPVSLPTVRAWIFQNKLPVVRVGRKVFIRREVLEKIEMEGLEAVSKDIV